MWALYECAAHITHDFQRLLYLLGSSMHSLPRSVVYSPILSVTIQTYNLLQGQVHGALKFPLPSVSYSSEHGHQGIGLGEGTYEMRLDQLNPCIRL